MPALDYLIASNRASLGDDVPELKTGRLDAKGKNVVVIGGGDTAMDCVRTAVRQGAASVKCLYRRDRANMPGSQREVSYAEEEGVEFVFLAQPEAFLGRGEAHRRAGPAHPSGPGRCHRPPGAAGHRGIAFHAERRPRAEGAGLRSRGYAHRLQGARARGHPLGHDEDRPSQHDDQPATGVFAAGDIVRGASLVVWAIRDGRDAAEHIHAYVTRKAEVSAAVGVAAE